MYLGVHWIFVPLSSVATVSDSPLFAFHINLAAIRIVEDGWSNSVPRTEALTSPKVWKQRDLD